MFYPIATDRGIFKPSLATIVSTVKRAENSSSTAGTAKSIEGADASTRFSDTAPSRCEFARSDSDLLIKGFRRLE